MPKKRGSQKVLTKDEIIERMLPVMSYLDKAAESYTRRSQLARNRIDQAALNGDNDGVKAFIAQKHGFDNAVMYYHHFKEDLVAAVQDTIEQITLAELQPAIEGCLGILNNTPDLSNLENSLTALNGELKSGRAKVDNLLQIFQPKAPKKNPFGQFDSNAPVDMNAGIENEDWYKNEYREMELRLKPKVAPETVTNISTNPVADKNGDLTGNLDIAGLIKEENNKD